MVAVQRLGVALGSAIAGAAYASDAVEMQRIVSRGGRQAEIYAALQAIAHTGCCGMSGLFGYHPEFYPLASA